MSDTTNTTTPDKQACLHLESKNIKPDVRVAYEEGMVLGLDEFVQEQRYHLEKDYLHNRGLHGYGTVYGLAVSIVKSVTPDSQTPALRSVDFYEGEKVLIRVEPGVGVDQRGRTFVLRQPYCIDLGNWVSKLKTKPGLVTPEDDEEPSYYPIYIRARYDETCGDTVTVAGQECSSNETNFANSRIYDSVVLEPAVESPVMSAWNYAQRFAWLMSKIRKVPGIALDTDAESALLDYVRHSLVEPDYMDQFDIVLAGLKNQPSPDYIQLPEGNPGTNSLISKLSLAYLTDVAPLGHLVDAYQQPEKPSQNDILLGQLNLVADATEQNITTIHNVTLIEDNRPYLLGTQIFQELANISNRDKNRRRLFASLHVQSSTSLFLWIHHPADKILKLPPKLGSNTLPPNPPPGAAIGGVVLTSYGTEFAGDITRLTDEFYTIELEHEGNSNLISVGSPVELTLNLDHLTDKKDKPLDTTLFNDFVGLNDDGSVITIHTFADNLAAVHSFASISARQDDTQGFVLDVGFDMDVSMSTDVTPLWCQIFVQNSELPTTDRQLDPDNPRLWHLFLPKPDKENSLLILRFNTEAIKVGNQFLSQWIHDEQINFVGYDGTKFIELTYVVPTLFTKKKVEDIVDGRIDGKISAAKTDLRENDIEPLQVLPFATITPILVGENITFEIWLHPTLTATNYGDMLVLDNKNLQIKTENAGIVDSSVTFQISPFDKANPNIFTVTITPSKEKDLDIAYLRFVFLTDNILWGGASLKAFKKSHDIRFFGNYLSTDSKTGYDYIVIYVRNQIMPILKKVPPVITLKALAAAEPKAEAVPSTPKPRTRRAGGKS